LRKLLTKPIWWWERRRSYEIPSRFDRLPSIPVTRGAKRFIVLTTVASLNDALWAAWSWHRFLQDHFELQLVVDGRITESQKQAAARLFPGLRMFAVETLLADFRKTVPGFTPFFDHHPLGKKLGLILALQREGPLLFSDHDVLAFNLPDEILSQAAADVPFYIAEEHDGVFDEEILQRARELGVDHARELNSGLLYVPRGSLSVELAAKLLADWRPPLRSWFTEQTVLSVLMHQADARSLPRAGYVISNRRQFYWEKDCDYTAIVARHFTKTVRHVMYARGMPELLQQSKMALNGRA